MSSRKKFFADDVLRTGKVFLDVCDIVDRIIEEGTDNEYGVGQINEFTDEELSRYDITATEFYNVIPVLRQIRRMKDGLSITPGDYMLALNKIRRVVI